MLARTQRQTGTVLLLILIMGLGLMVLGVVSLNLSIVHSRTLRDQRIVASAKQRTTGMEQIAVAMENINQATMQNLASTRQAEKSAQDLSSVTQQLEGVVARYKLN